MLVPLHWSFNCRICLLHFRLSWKRNLAHGRLPSCLLCISLYKDGYDLFVYLKSFNLSPHERKYLSIFTNFPKCFASELILCKAGRKLLCACASFFQVASNIIVDKVYVIRTLVDGLNFILDYLSAALKLPLGILHDESQRTYIERHQLLLYSGLFAVIART